MDKVIVTDVPRVNLDEVDKLASFGVATVHEALSRTGLTHPYLRPIQQGTRVAGNAVTVLCWPGDNLMIHAAIEQCRTGDILVVTTASPNQDGLFGELFATALKQRGVRGLVTTTGIRDTEELRQLEFPAWSAAVSAQGTVKSTAGAVNVPIVVAGQWVRPGDVIVADDDGVLCVQREKVAVAIESSDAREKKESAARAAFASGELGLDRYGLRSVLEEQGVLYRPWAER